ncbi:MAG: GatB/YqeY domain-containing protein [Candidatus Omnitrophica bacterium]|nr:GatB/YqeY domain-containing protein [Candidatus Omnitrophota bacterium]
MIEQELNDELKIALKNKDLVKIGTTRLIINEIKNKKINSMIRDNISQADFLLVINKMAKQRKESIESFSAAGREDLVKKESEELAILESYLPEALSKEKLTAVIDATIAALGASSPSDMGKVMKEVIAKTNGLADGKEISAIVREKLK